jgi:hypothetical protein
MKSWSSWVEQTLPRSWRGGVNRELDGLTYSVSHDLRPAAGDGRFSMALLEDYCDG